MMTEAQEQPKPGAVRLPEWALDVLLWQEFENDHLLAAWLVNECAGDDAPDGDPVAVRGQPWHQRSNGETDLLLTVEYADRTVAVHIEDKIGADWSNETQALRYSAAVSGTTNELAVLIAPEVWLEGRAEVAAHFNARIALEALADRLELDSADDRRRRWVAQRIRDAASPRLRALANPAPDVDRWAAGLAEVASDYDLRPKSTGFTRTTSADPKAGRFIIDEHHIGGPGDPYLVYKLGKPDVRPTMVDLAWHLPSERLRGRLGELAARDGHDTASAKTEFYVRVLGGEAFGSLFLHLPFEEQIPQARAMLAVAAELRDWWRRIASTVDP